MTIIIKTRHLEQLLADLDRLLEKDEISKTEYMSIALNMKILQELLAIREQLGNELMK